MPEQDIITPVAEGQATPEVPVEIPVVTVEKTIGELTPEPVKQVNTIPEGAFLNEKKARKEAEKRIKELEDMVANGGTKSEVSADIKSIAEEYDIDPSFLDKLTKSIRSETEKDIADKFKPLEEREKKDHIDKIFTKHYDEAMAKMPEFSGVVNADVIKNLSLLSANSNKTFTQLIEETYGNAITGKRTIPQTTPAGGKDPAPLDYQRAVKDPEYFKEVMSNPKTKAEYNHQMLIKGF